MSRMAILPNGKIRLLPSQIGDYWDSSLEWFDSLSRRNQLLITLGAGAIGAISLVFLWDNSTKRSRIKRLKREIGVELSRSASETGLQNIRLHGRNQLNGILSDHNDGNAMEDQHATTPAEEMLIREQLTRNYSFLGEDRMAKVRKSFVVVIGLGGSHAAHMLVRSGVERIRLVDFDQVTLSSLNRNAVATQSDVGMPKATCMKSHLLDIAPHAYIDTRIELFSSATAETLLSGNPDYVLDCIDNIDTKVELIHYCMTNNIKIVSSMGAGAKSDASRVQIADISDTQEDPLARSVRRRLRAVGIESGLPVVYSAEKPNDVKLLPLTEEQMANPDEYAALPDFRVRILPVLGTLPALFGSAMASHVLVLISGFPVEPLVVIARHATIVRMHRDISTREIDHFAIKYPSKRLTVSDVGYIFEEIWNSRSALSGKFDGVLLTRWDIRKAAGFGNLICLTKSEALKHEALDPDQREEYYGKEFCEKVAARFEKERHLNKWREIE
ncbi:hypothetical protein SmJEL517_g01442 [Synchytrium microbalum]|uniref:THIF-type NAD/FAD binding fold domain-containing protein n=1 Tax=Synchytrium microbalum TaxID=1806994 RepID=A0A507CA09_9FUNG|nr:uncharacterized protein SmJEL517_g01442 [Synchytrium microbalum]TPX36178.1 hypothetical protein SmJEL517_g01442 [Synchytrium microbalum]